MTNTKDDAEQHAQLIAEMRRAEQQRKFNYREQALRLFPHVCGRCSREFSGKKLSELTVHHRDHNHDNNPPNGSNWELLCLYCHDHEHTRGVQADRPTDTQEPTGPALAHSPFAGLSERLKPTD